ncbi:MAG TPA: acetyl-CoA carboxylase biotin carboxyl carrier protein [Chlamydiales bacterium]|nr:acetyl-CoA carboxylase biotin carboxyl carrier protein [Chlamydiales bacterium]
MSKEYNDIEQIKELIGYLEESNLSKIIFKKGDMEIRLEKEAVPLKYPAPRTIGETEAPFQSEFSLQGERGGSHRAEPAKEVSGTFVTSPMVGTFYASPGPHQPHFVKIGDRVDEHTIVCIIEAMKVMNEVKAGASGTIVEVLADNAQPVEFGTRLFRVQ